MEIENAHIYYINSNNKESGTHSNFTYRLDLPKNADRCVILQADIPKSYTLVNSTNKTFYLTEQSTEVSVVLTVGNYSLRQILTALSSKLTTASPNGWTYTATYSSAQSTGKIIYTCSASGTGKTIRIRCANSELYEQLGFEKDSTNTFTDNNDNTYVLNSANVIKLQLETSLFIRSDLSQGNTNVLQEIFSSGFLDFGNISFENKAPLLYSKPIILNNTNVYRFYLTDENDQAIDLNGLNVNFTLLVYKKNNILDFIKNIFKIQLLQS